MSSKSWMIGFLMLLQKPLKLNLMCLPPLYSDYHLTLTSAFSPFFHILMLSLFFLTHTHTLTRFFSYLPSKGNQLVGRGPPLNLHPWCIQARMSAEGWKGGASALQAWLGHVPTEALSLVCPVWPCGNLPKLSFMTFGNQKWQTLDLTAGWRIYM